MGDTTVRYTYRLRPGAAAQRALAGEWGRARWVWNQAVAALRDTGDWVRDQGLTAWRAEQEWLRAGSVVPQQQALRDFRATRAKGSGRRKFKSKRKTPPSLNYTRRGFTLRDGRLVLAGGIRVPVVWSRDLPSDPSSVRVYQDSLGHWYASFVVRRAEHPAPAVGAAIGIDWGVSTLATATDPAFDLPHAGHAQRAAAALATQQRRMARRAPQPGQPASKGYRKAKRAAARAHKKVARQRQDTARKWAVRVVAAHDLIAVEDFRPRFLARSRLARKAADGAVGQTKATLIEYAQRAGRKVVLVPPAYTTMTCSGCGARTKTRLLLSERVFACQVCGLVEDRDRNAARVILATAGFNRAGADAVRHTGLPSGEVRVLTEPGIPRL